MKDYWEVNDGVGMLGTDTSDDRRTLDIADYHPSSPYESYRLVSVIKGGWNKHVKMILTSTWGRKKPGDESHPRIFVPKLKYKSRSGKKYGRPGEEILVAQSNFNRGRFDVLGENGTVLILVRWDIHVDQNIDVGGKRKNVFTDYLYWVDPGVFGAGASTKIPFRKLDKLIQAEMSSALVNSSGKTPTELRKDAGFYRTSWKWING